MKSIDKFVLVLVASLALLLAGCGGGSSTQTPEPDPMPPTLEQLQEMRFQAALTAIQGAETTAAAQAAVVAAVAAGITGAQLQSLNMAVANRTAALAEAEAAAVRQALVDAAMCEAATAACVAAHDALIAALEADLDALQASDDATNAEEQAARDAIAAARDARDAIQMDLEELDRTTLAGREVGEALDAAHRLSEDRSAEAIAAAKVAIEEAKQAVGDDDSYNERINMAETAVMRAEELNAIDVAVMAAENAADGLAEDSTADAVTAAQALIDAAQALIDGNTHLTVTEEASYGEEIEDIQRPVTVAKNRNDEADEKAEEDRLAEEKEEERKANEAMAATAAKLYAGISAQMGDGDLTNLQANDRDAGYNANGTAILVSIGGETAAAAAITLSEDKDATVADNHGWEGKRYTRTSPASEGMYEAVVYSNVEAPTQGKKFGGAAANDEFEYVLTTGVTDANAATQNGEITVVTGAVDTTTQTELDAQARIAIPSVTRTSGTETFKFSENEITDRRIDIAGNYHGVSGTFYCTPTTRADGCSASVAAKGFVLAGGTWVFKPSNPNARVLDSADEDYASYGWWIHKGANDGAFTASAFVDRKGDAPTPLVEANTGALRGTASYTGGAAGKYALSSSTGGTNDAGHFTARATLEATFAATHNITGTIDNFVGADGQSRDWSVKLNSSVVTNLGVIAGDPEDTTDTGAQQTVWTLGGTAADASGEWSGTLEEAGTDNVPQVATGTFYSEYGTAGRMVGAFGANKE